jgi:galactokinase
MQAITEIFKKQFNSTPTLIVFSPGRINIIGEHTDYNEGYVLPAAIDKGIYFAIAKRNDEIINLHAANFEGNFSTTLNQIQISTTLWANYILGVVNQINLVANLPAGFDAVFMGNLPIGAGLSSSAALECAAAYALNSLFNLNLQPLQMVKMAQLAEHTYAGVMCGIMDQFASMMGKKDYCLKLDCKTLDYSYVPINIENYSIVLFNTNVKHSLASSEYNTRRQECAQGVAWVAQEHPHITSLRNVTIDMLTKYVKPNSEVVYNRCLYVVQEIDRLKTACAHLEQGNIAALGTKMFETHNGLSNLYQVSCKELDFLVQQVNNNSAVLGARMMGGGFGGCTINIIENSQLQNVIESTKIAYEKTMQKPFEYYVTQTANGTSVI